MVAPKNNKFWKLRSKHGRDKIFKTPDILWDAACEYFEYIESNPLLEDNVFHASCVITHAETKKKRPFTLIGLCLFIDCNERYFNDFELSLKGKSDKMSQDFSHVITRIRETIYNQKFEGAASGFFNPNIIARELGLKEQTENKTEHSISEDTSDLLKKLNEKLT